MSNTLSIPPNLFQRPVVLLPYYSERPWGGRRLESSLGKPLPEGEAKIGESWELSDHEDGKSMVAGCEEFDGMSFGELLQKYPGELIGREKAPEKFPLLIKYIDANENLSVQVHPDDQWCIDNGHNDRGKSECWYILDCDEDAQVVYGYRENTTEKEVKEAVENNDFSKVLNYINIRPGDFLTLPPGTVHAMLKGTIVCEIQQSSNTTFRVYDWDRKPERDLHIDESMQVTNYDLKSLPPVQSLGSIMDLSLNGSPNTRRILVRNYFFQVDMLDLFYANGPVRAGLTYPTGTIINVVEGQLRLETDEDSFVLNRGETYFLPAVMSEPTVTPLQDGARLLITISREV